MKISKKGSRRRESICRIDSKRKEVERFDVLRDGYGTIQQNSVSAILNIEGHRTLGHEMLLKGSRKGPALLQFRRVECEEQVLCWFYVLTGLEPDKVLESYVYSSIY